MFKIEIKLISCRNRHGGYIARNTKRKEEKINKKYCYVHTKQTIIQIMTQSWL